MQQYFSRLTVLGLLAVASTTAFAVAAPTAELKVTGQIVPGACKINVPHGADYGNVLVAKLATDKTTPLSEQDVPFTIACDADAKLALSVVDNKTGTAPAGLGAGNTILGVSAPPDANFFGLGTSNSKNIGGYAVQLKNVTVDSAATDVLDSKDRTTWTKSANALLDPAKSVSWATAGTTNPLAGKAIAGTLAVQAVIDKGSDLDLTNQIMLDGSATLTVDYL
ncbi:DUF1120 domain-containing protein [Burkholderia ubonensis]|uniref:DUF1120 domain-containing protein n=1 Tax=Burkholderia ubonensis TaxID=101571 RepID=UPI000AA132BB|nr:DUF1120 domain-containing protein [Burkholderia ubonensis]